MDALSEVLRLVRLTGAIFLNGEFTAPWAVESPPSHVLARSLLPRAECVVEYHLVAKGSCYIRVLDGEPVALEEGDLVMLPRGESHVLSSEMAISMTPLAADATQLPRTGESCRTAWVAARFSESCAATSLSIARYPVVLGALPQCARCARGGEVTPARHLHALQPARAR